MIYPESQPNQTQGYEGLGAIPGPGISCPLPLLPGRFCRREQRFLAEVELADGRRVWAHVPNSGALTGCLFPGMEVLLTPETRPGRRTAYTWRFCRVAGQWISIDTTAPNRLLARILATTSLPGLEPPLRYRPEVTLPGGGRLDFVVERDGHLHFVEVKSVTWVEEGVAWFPDGVTSRGRRHLQALAALVTQGHRAWNIFVVQRPAAQVVAPASHIDPAYARELAQAAQAGVQLLALATTITPPWISLAGFLPVRLSPLATAEPL